MITCNMIPGCNRLVWLIAAMLIFVLLLAAICWATTQLVTAQSDCPSAAYSVRPINTYANVRLAPPVNNTLAPIIGTMVASEEAVDIRSNWYQLCAGGYVSGAVVAVTQYTSTPRTTTPTQLPTLTMTPTQLPIVIRLEIDADNDGRYETVFDCQWPCPIRWGK